MPAKSNLTTCTVNGCERPFYGRGMCAAHYQRWKKSGEVPQDGTIQIRTKFSPDTFWRFVADPDERGCRLWLRADNGNGYGCLTINGKMHLAHRVSYELTYGPIPERIFVCHQCDVRKCCEPNHLFLGDVNDNQLDMALKGRAAKKLNPVDVREIREMHARGVSPLKIAQQFDINRSTVHKVVTRFTWDHVP